MNKFLIKKPNGFTLVEVMISVILIGVISALAMPRVRISLDKFKMNEGKQILIELMKAQNNYRLENGSYTDSAANLNIVIPSSKNFKTPEVWAAALPDHMIAKIEDINGKYYMKMSGRGSIYCYDIAASGYCTLLGM